MPYSAKKFYAVARGRKTGIFLTWEQCKRQVQGFSDERYKSFKYASDGEAFLRTYSVPVVYHSVNDYPSTQSVYRETVVADLLQTLPPVTQSVDPSDGFEPLPPMDETKPKMLPLVIQQLVDLTATVIDLEANGIHERKVELAEVSMLQLTPRFTRTEPHHTMGSIKKYAILGYGSGSYFPIVIVSRRVYNFPCLPLTITPQNTAI